MALRVMASQQQHPFTQAVGAAEATPRVFRPQAVLVVAEKAVTTVVQRVTTGRSASPARAVVVVGRMAFPEQLTLSVPREVRALSSSDTRWPHNG